MAGAATQHRKETEHERLDRNLDELLGELRVALPGVQVLFAFLLIVPFNARFTEVTPFQEKVYFATLLVTAVSSLLLIAPGVHHRLLFRRDEKRYLVRTANRLAISGLSLLGLAVALAIMLVTDFLFGTATTIVATCLIVLPTIAVWYAIPIRRRLAGSRSAVDPL